MNYTRKNEISKKRKSSSDEMVTREILKYGSGIMRTPQFAEARTQPHHKISTVADHTLNVTIASARLASFLEKRKIKVNRRDVIEGALLHDFGIIGREKKFKNNFECGQCHATESVAVARELIPDLNDNVANIIENHMFPVTPHPPKSREGVVVLLADKYCAVAEWVTRILRKPYHAEEKRIIQEQI